MDTFANRLFFTRSELRRLDEAKKEITNLIATMSEPFHDAILTAVCTVEPGDLIRVTEAICARALNLITAAENSVCKRILEDNRRIGNMAKKARHDEIAAYVACTSSPDSDDRRKNLRCSPCARAVRRGRFAHARNVIHQGYIHRIMTLAAPLRETIWKERREARRCL